jgi:hypothetical protein
MALQSSWSSAATCVFWVVCGVVRSPILTVGDTDCFRDSGSSVRCSFAPDTKLNRENVFAFRLMGVIVGARALGRIAAEIDGVRRAAARLRRNYPQIALALHFHRRGDLKSSLFAWIHVCRSPIIVATMSLHLGRMSSDCFLLTRSRNVATMWLVEKAKRKRTRSTAKTLKNDLVRMRIPTDQKHKLMEAAARDGLELSQWLRQVALREAGVLPEAK